jgi:hypothetical protein
MSNERAKRLLEMLLARQRREILDLPDVHGAEG